MHAWPPVFQAPPGAPGPSRLSSAECFVSALLKTSGSSEMCKVQSDTIVELPYTFSRTKPTWGF